MDVRPWGLTGKEAEQLLEEAGMTVNKNTIPYDPESPFVTSGIRIGTAALTSRGMKESDMDAIAANMADILKAKVIPRSRRRCRKASGSYVIRILFIKKYWSDRYGGVLDGF